MSNVEIKQLLFIVLFIIINLVVSFSITNLLGIFNTVIYRSVISMISDITYEMVIFMGLVFIESGIYEMVQIKFKII